MAVFYVGADNVQNFVLMNVLRSRHCQPFFEKILPTYLKGKGDVGYPYYFYEINLIKQGKNENFTQSKGNKGGRGEMTQRNAFFAFVLHIFWCQN